MVLSCIKTVSDSNKQNKKMLEYIQIELHEHLLYKKVMLEYF